MPIDAAVLIAACPDAILVFNGDGSFQDANPAATRLLGYSRNELLALVPRELIGDTAEWWHAASARLQLTDAWRGEITLRGKDGARVTVDASSIRLEDQGRRRYVTFLRDITAAKVEQAARAATHMDMAQVLERMTDGFIAMDAAWRVTAINATAEQSSGQHRDALLGRSLWELFPDLAHSTLPDLYRRAITSGQPTVAAFERPLTGMAYEVQLYPSSAGLAVFFRDITDRKREHEALVAALTHAQAANHLTRRFLAMMSHELRTPLQAILGYAELMLTTVGDALPADAQEDLRTIHIAAGRLGDLIKQMLDLSRLEAGQQELGCEPLVLSSIVAEVVQESVPLAAAKQLPIDVAVPDELPPVQGDAMAVRQILLNLVGNAIKFTEKGHVSIMAEASDDEVALHVADTGVGMGPQVIAHIFEEFWQAEGGMTRRFEGSGLGLAITKRLTEAMGGRLAVDSVPGTGSRFTVSLPRGEPKAARHVQ